MEEQTNKNNQQNMQEQDYDDLDDLGLFHKSSLKQKEAIPYPQLCQEVYSIKKYIDQNNQSHIGDYIEHQNIGRGAFASVIKAEKQGKYYAIKIYSLLRLRSQRFFAADGSFANGQQMFQNQIDIIKRMDCPNLVKCEEILHGGHYTYVVNEICDLGQIMTWSQINNNYKRNEAVVKYIGTKYKTQSMEDISRIVFLQVAKGIQYMHTRKITNRDIKVDNILCKTTQNQGDDIKIGDFTTVRYSNDDKSYFISGTPGFRGPQQQFASSQGYSCCSTDIWSFGVSLYAFYYENFPFMGETQLQIDTLALNKQLDYPSQTPKWLVQLIQKTTKKNWKQRIKIDEVITIMTSNK